MYRNISYDDNDYNDNRTIINTNLTTSIVVYQLNLSKAVCKIIFLYYIDFLTTCSQWQISKVKCFDIGIQV